MSKFQLTTLGFMTGGRRARLFAAVLVLVALLSACEGGRAPALVQGREVQVSEPNCANRTDRRMPLFGELHLHTKYSTDAYIYSVLADPRDAYAFARGDTIALAPYDENGQAERSLKLRRPLDFAAVTDHAEGFGFMYHCLNPDAPGYNAAECLMVRREVPVPAIVPLAVLVTAAVGLPVPVGAPMCSLPGIDCDIGKLSVWQDIQAAAEAYYDRSPDCAFTTFIAYEWSASPLGNNIHRNVVFRNEHVPARPISTYETNGPNANQLWQGLHDQCLDAGTGCDVLAIPHNSNISGGWMFPDPASPEEARTRAELETVAEIFQHKGSSECRFDRTLGRGVETTDEQCAFEQVSSYNLFADRIPSTGVQYLPPDVLEPRNYLRNALKDGLKFEQQMGSNPFKMGFIGSTDSHNGTAGATDEDNFLGHVGSADSTAAARVSFSQGTGSIDWSPGGLAVVWSEENSRNGIFESLKRRETYATSGTRPIVRVFGGWDFSPELCGSAATNDADLVAVGYRDGVPMGGDLPAAPEGAVAPQFAINALMDVGVPEHPGTPLQQIQMIKGWVDADGVTHEKVFQVAGDPANGAAVNPEDCSQWVEPAKTFRELCTVWSDPEFDAAQSAFYYARVLENPSCRWSTYDCKSLGVDPFAADCMVQALSSSEPNLEPCCVVEPTIQERAWTSPIWYRAE